MAKKKVSKKSNKKVKRKVNKGIEVREVKRDNKSRKGVYFYIKEKGKRAKEFKKNPGISKKEALWWYKHGYNTKRGGITKKKVKREMDISKLSKKYANIETALGEGIASTTMTNLKYMRPYNIKNSYLSLLKNKDRIGDGKEIVKDDLLRELLVKPENVEKWKSRVMIEVGLINESGELLGEYKNSIPKTLMDAKREVVDSVKVGEEFSIVVSGLDREVRGKGWHRQAGSTVKGKIGNIRLKLTFRKAR